MMMMKKLLVLLASAAIVMLLWNAIIPTLIGWGVLNYLQALGLLILCRLLFGSSPRMMERAHLSQRGMHRSEIIEQVKDMNKEERREYIKNYMHNHKNCTCNQNKDGQQ